MKCRSMKMLIFSFRPFTSDWADEKSPIILTDEHFVFNWLYFGSVCICEGIHEEINFKSILGWCVERNHEPECLCIYTESMKLSWKSRSLCSISQSPNNFEPKWKWFLITLGLCWPEGPITFYNFKIFCLLEECNMEWTGFLTKFSEYDLV